MKMENIQPKFLMMTDEKNEEKVVLYLHGVVGSGWFGDISCEGVRNELDGVHAKEIEVHIHSNGGDAFEGVAICNYLRNHPAQVTAIVDGMCASAASVIAMGADKVIMPSNTVMMVHRAATMAFGNAVTLRKRADMLKDVDESLIESYTSRFKGEHFELESLLDNETYMSASKAKSYGFCDEVTAPVKNASEEIEESDEKENEDSNSTTEGSDDDNSEEITKDDKKQVQNAERAMRFINALMESTKL
ncbi:Clp protease [Bacillus cereus]|uniref:ATP-dependent Clp protease proteolytic subunit n=1 Tax=Bacillus cereus TaxID=1396 RepID=A0A9X7CHJ5_BACCE|nr:head maturation protease, ClpP-related [Bacillus cereus]PGS64725.1 Clp protease [Bacillus cereus]